jgi:DNA-binding transcriptional MerR regulator
MTDQPDELSIGQVAERTGLSVHALRFYERESIFLSPIRRAVGGRRVYTEDDVDWLMLCTILRGAAMPLEDIRRYTELVRAGDGNEPERLALLRQHEERVREQQEKLDRCLDLIRFKIGVYEDILAGDTAPAEDKASLPATIIPKPRGISGPGCGSHCHRAGVAWRASSSTCLVVQCTTRQASRGQMGRR